MRFRLLKFVRIPLLVTLIYLALTSYIDLTQFGILSVVEPVSVDVKKTFSPERKTDELDIHLLKGEKVTGKFKTKENNFGILLVKFAKLSAIVTDKIIFRIKVDGEESWHYENTYEAKQFQDNEYFTFGFSPIANSKNKTYVFEIESLAGAYGNGIGVILDKPQPALVYKYSAEDMKNYKTLLSFIFKKFAYTFEGIDYWRVGGIFVVTLFIILFIKKKKITAKNLLGFFKVIKKNPRNALKIIFDDIKSDYLWFEKKAIKILNKTSEEFSKTKFYLLFLNTNTKKRLVVGLLIFLLALSYRFSSTLVNQHLFFYAGLGGQGDYDQFIRAATCAIRNFCSAILGQNFLFESSILGIFFEIFGFTGALKAYLYLMIILSSIVATLPHFLFSRKNWISIGGIIGGFYLATSNFLTHMSLNFPPDNGSLFTFSMFFIIYLLTLQFGTIRWLLLFGFWGTIDGLNKALFLINDPAALAIFSPVYFYENVRKKLKFPIGGKKVLTPRRLVISIFKRENIKILLLSIIPLVVFLTIYSVWEYFVQIKFSAPYWLKGLIQSRGASYVSYTSFDDSPFTESIFSQLYYLAVSAIIMIKRLIVSADLRIIFLTPIFAGLVLFTFTKSVTSQTPFLKLKFQAKKLILAFILSAVVILLLTLIKNNYYKVHEIFAGEYISDAWTDNIYLQIFLMSEIIILFILNFKYSALKLTLPIIPYIIMLIILTKNSPFARLHIHVVAWSIILLAYIIDWIIMNINKYSTTRIRIILGSILLILFTYVYGFPKMVTMITQLNSGIALSQNQVRYLKWVEDNLPENAVILAGGKSDLVTVAENIKRPIIYNSLWREALLILPYQIPGVKPTDFEIINQLKHTYNLKINEIPGVKPTDFSIISELKNKDNFKRKKYIILEDDIYLWRDRVTGVVDSVFVPSPKTLHVDDYSIKVYKSNPDLKKAIYELNLKDSL